MDTADESALRSLREEARKPGITVTACVPVKESLTLWLKAPFASVARARKVFPALLDVELPFPLEQCVYQFPDVRRMPDKTTRALAVAARRGSVEALLESGRSAGVDPEMLDHEGLALWTQSIRETPLGPDASRVLLRVASESTTIVVGENGGFVNAHGIGAGTGDCDTLAETIQRYIRAEIEPGAAVQWAFCGARAANAAFVEKLHGALSEEWPGPLAVHREPESFLLRALAERALSAGPLRCNLRRGRLVHPKILNAARRQAVAGAALLLAAGLLLFGINAAWRIVSARRFQQARREVAALAADLAPGERIPYGMEVAEVKKSLEKQSELTRPFRDAFAPSLAVRLADIVNAGKADNLHFETISLREDRVSIAGTAGDWDRCENFRKRLRAMGYTVELDRQEAVADRLIRFTIRASLSKSHHE